MVNRTAAHPQMPVQALRRNRIAQVNRVPAARRARARLLIVNSGVFLISTSGAIVVVHTAGNPFALVAFVLFLLGIWLVLLALVADKFPRAARVAVAIASALQDHLIGGN
uniref:Uncharacterized protein n=1 Tax=Oryza punctata TaxID=4537 RepID=A0A0E0LEL6_ORYPU